MRWHSPKVQLAKRSRRIDMLLNIHCLRRWHWNSETLCSLVFLCLIIPWAGDVLCMRARPYCMQYMEEEDEEFTRYRLCMYYRISSAQLNRELVCKETSKMWSLLGCEQFLTQYFLARKAKNGGASRNERHKERASLIFWSLVAIKTGHETAASPWHHNDILKRATISIW